MSYKFFVGFLLSLVIHLLSSCEKKYEFAPPPAKDKVVPKIYITKIEILNFDFNSSASFDPDLKPEVYLCIWPEDSTYFFTNVVSNVSPANLPLVYNFSTPYSWPSGSQWIDIIIKDQDGAVPNLLNDDHLGSESLHLYSSEYEPGYTGYKILVTDGERQTIKVFFKCV